MKSENPDAIIISADPGAAFYMFAALVEKDILWKHEPIGVQREPWLGDLANPRKCPHLRLFRDMLGTFPERLMICCVSMRLPQFVW